MNSYFQLSRTSSASTPTAPGSRTPRIQPGTPVVSSAPMQSLNVKRVTLTSKKNWWMVEMDEEEEARPPLHMSNAFSPPEDNRSTHHHYSTHATHSTHATLSHGPISQPYADVDPGSSPEEESPMSSSQVFHPPNRHPSAIFSFPTPTAYAAPPNPTANIGPIASGSTSELFKCIVKKPEVVQLEINGEMQTNASDVTTQFLAELRVYTTVTRHRNIVSFLGCLEAVGMVLEFVDGRTLLDVVKARPELTKDKKIDYHNQLLDGLQHLHSFGLSHGDLSLLNVFVTSSSDTIKLLDFGRSVSADSYFESPSAEPDDPFKYLARSAESHRKIKRTRRVEQIHLGTRPFTAPEILRGECQDARLADAYSFGIILVCLDLCGLVDCDPAEQSRDIVPPYFVEDCPVFGQKIAAYLRHCDIRQRITREDMIAVRAMAWLDDDD